MTRWSIAVLLLLNCALAAWSFGAFSRWGWAPHDGREPERLAGQVNPEAVRLSVPEASAMAASEALPPASAAASTPASAPANPQ